jgi:lipopolysaccharide/colanic/teichoic acid biosynthesis glycosyltransferase
MIKRLFDAVLAICGLVLLSPIMFLAGLCIKLDSRGPVFFKQERMGKDFQPFFISKFRTMVHDAPYKGGPLTLAQDPRVTRVGRFLRISKIDELPQLINVLKGEMSLVGPRPEVRRYVELFRHDYEEILKVRPGITDLASLKYRDEAEALTGSDNPEKEYLTRILPDKIKLAKEYISRSSFLFDLALIIKTILKISVLSTQNHPAPRQH